MFADAGDIRRCLRSLGEKLSLGGHPSVSVLICGGSALNLSGLVSRTTGDVDALGLETCGPELNPIPDWLRKCSAEVAEELGLEEGWFNDAASSLQAIGLPEGIVRRSTRESFGPGLEVAIASRLDLIALKCFAALDPKSGRKHLGDLVDLAPEEGELAFAAAWLLDRPTSPQFRKAFADLCLVLGHPLAN